MARFSRIPLFPLNVVLYPEQALPLHIFEPRYRAMVEYCTETQEPFGVVLDREEGDLAEVGCTARIRKLLQEYEDGRKDIMTVGEERFRIRTIYTDNDYLEADIEALEESSQVLDPHKRERVITQHLKLMEVFGQQPRPTVYSDVPSLSFFLAQNSGLSLDQKQHLLEVESEIKRVEYLIEHFERVLPRLREAEANRRKVKSDGYFGPDSV